MDLDLVELEDWELLNTSDTSSVDEIKGFEVLKDDCDVIQETSGARSSKKLVGDFCSDDGLIDEFEGSKEVGFLEKSENEVGFDGVEEIVVRDLNIAENEKIEVGFLEKGEIEVGFDDIVVRDLGIAENEKNEVGFLEKGEIEVGFDDIVVRDLGSAEKGEIEVGILEKGGIEEVDTDMSDGANSNFRDGLVSGGGGEGDEHCDDVDIISGEMKSGGEGEKRVMVWWKLPFEFLKYFVLKTSRVWTVSMAAAVVGFLILGRRYYNMKRKSRSLQVNVTMDDKNISQLKSRVVRLNEAFSVVKHVPIIRSSFPAAGMTPWPAMTLR